MLLMGVFRHAMLAGFCARRNHREHLRTPDDDATNGPRQARSHLQWRTREAFRGRERQLILVRHKASGNNVPLEGADVEDDLTPQVQAEGEPANSHVSKGRCQHVHRAPGQQPRCPRRRFAYLHYSDINTWQDFGLNDPPMPAGISLHEPETHFRRSSPGDNVSRGQIATPADGKRCPKDPRGVNVKGWHTLKFGRVATKDGLCVLKGILHARRQWHRANYSPACGQKRSETRRLTEHRPRGPRRSMHGNRVLERGRGCFANSAKGSWFDSSKST